MVFYGKGSVWIPSKHRFVRFVGGEYKTSDESEMFELKDYKHDETEIKEPEEATNIGPLRRGRKPKNA
jgi:hypothetical protein